MKINCFGVGTDPSNDRMTRGAMRVSHLTLVKLKRKEKGKKERKTEGRTREKREREKGLYLLFTIYGDWVVGFWRTKN